MIVQGVQQRTLDNQLTVLVKETHHAPVSTLWVWYQVGVRNERAGITGISHWVEHMMFRGTERFPRGVADRLLSRQGADHNAMTYLDWTTYFQTLPAGRLSLALQIEADRMLNAQFAPQDTELERTVVISERQGAENSPLFLLQEEVSAAAFQAHPYGYMTIGRMQDLETISRDELYHHYRAYYTPNNAVVVAVGDFDSAAMLGQIEALFGDIPAGPPLPAVQSVEPAQGSARRVQVAGPGDTSYVTVALRAPPATHPDFFSFAVMDTLLGGPRSMGLWDESEASRTSRLYKALVDTGLASEAGSFLLPTIDPYLFSCSATVQSGRTAAAVEQALLAELERLAVQPVSSQELQRALHQTRAQFAYSAESVTNQGFWLGMAATIADLQWLGSFIDSLAAVTAEDVQRVAHTYLAQDKRTVGHYTPGNPAERQP